MCVNCKDRGMTYAGNGHRAAGYPFAEVGVAVSCSCDLGKALDAGQRIPMPPVTEVSDATIAKVAAHKAAFARKVEAFGERVAAEVRAKSGSEPQWVKDRRKENEEFNAWRAGKVGETT